MTSFALRSDRLLDMALTALIHWEETSDYWSQDFQQRCSAWRAKSWFWRGCEPWPTWWRGCNDLKEIERLITVATRAIEERVERVDVDSLDLLTLERWKAGLHGEAA